MLDLVDRIRIVVMFVNGLFILLFVAVMYGLICAVAASLRATNGPTRRTLLAQPHLTDADSSDSSPATADPLENGRVEPTVDDDAVDDSSIQPPADAVPPSQEPPSAQPADAEPAPHAPTRRTAVSQPEGLGDDVLHGGGERVPSDPRIAALERKVHELHETLRRNEHLRDESAALPQRSDPSPASPSPPSEQAATPPRLDTDSEAAALYDALRAQIDQSPLDVIARRRLHSELETWQRRGGTDDGLLVGIRHDLQSARSEPSRPSLFEARRPRDEAERLRADLALRERQTAELRSQLASLREPTSTPAAERLNDPFDRVPRRDDLKVIKGIGKRMERLLNELGVTTLAQLAAFEQPHVDRVARRLEGLGDDIVSEDWVGQARRILARRRKRYEAG